MAAPHRRNAGGPGAAEPARRSPSRRCPKCHSTYPLDFVVCPKDATALEKPDLGDDPLLGEILAGSFCITGLLGEGAMGRVYEAEHTRLPRKFAIKVMHEELVKYPEALARVEREAQAIARVASEHVIEVIDLVRLPDGRPCLVTELLQGDELGELLDQRGKLSIADAMTIGKQICRGLSAAHAVGVLHRDLKPSNLFLVKRSDGKPFTKILDFGIAKMSDGAQLTLTGMVLGTPAYMAPEQARGDKNVDARADVYSAGAVLYHMLTGVPPFEGDDPAVLLSRVASEDPRPLRALVPTIPEAVERVVMRALARNAAARPATVADLERELDAVDPASQAPRVPEERASTVGARDTVVDPPPVAVTADIVVPRPAPLPALSTSVRPFSIAPAPQPSWSRTATAGLAFGFALLVGAAVLEAAAVVIKLASSRSKISGTDIAIAAAIAAVATAATLAVAGREVSSRWTHTMSIGRLGSTLASSALALLAAAGLGAIVWADGSLLGVATDARGTLKVELVLVVGPLLLGLAVFATRLRAGAIVDD